MPSGKVFFLRAELEAAPGGEESQPEGMTVAEEREAEIEVAEGVPRDCGLNSSGSGGQSGAGASMTVALGSKVLI